MSSVSFIQTRKTPDPLLVLAMVAHDSRFTKACSKKVSLADVPTRSHSSAEGNNRYRPICRHSNVAEEEQPTVTTLAAAATAIARAGIDTPIPSDEAAFFATHAPNSSCEKLKRSNNSTNADQSRAYLIEEPISSEMNMTCTSISELGSVKRRKRMYASQRRHQPTTTYRKALSNTPSPSCVPTESLSVESSNAQLDIPKPSLATCMGDSPPGADPRIPQSPNGSLGTSGYAVEESNSTSTCRDFSCPSCGKRFTRAYNLKSHMKTHTAERPYGCQYCSKAFARKQDCLRHMRIHTNDRPFICSRCSSAFSRQDALSRHEYTCSASSKISVGLPLRNCTSSLVERIEVGSALQSCIAPSTGTTSSAMEPLSQPSSPYDACPYGTMPPPAEQNVHQSNWTRCHV